MTSDSCIKSDPFVEYERINKNVDGIVKNNPYLMLQAAQDKWIFPWETNIQINVKELFLPVNTIGLVEQSNEKIKTFIFTLFDTHNPLVIPVRTKGILPRKICAGETIARISILNFKECYVIDYSE